MKKDMGKIKFTLIKEYEDGGATYEFEYDDKFRDNLKRILGIKRLDSRRVKKIILEAIDNMIRKNNEKEN